MPRLQGKVDALTAEREDILDVVSFPEHVSVCHGLLFTSAL